tara:strand:+ start:174 stop:332 length:159 start_codon:yes stop_codon:yes gene_type:complete
MNKILSNDEIKKFKEEGAFFLKINLISSGLINCKKELKGILRNLVQGSNLTL